MKALQVSDSSSCIFPALTTDTSFELFQANVEAVKVTSKKWPTTEAAQPLFEANQLILATNSHLAASAALIRVRRRWLNGEFQTGTAQNPTEWVKASWEALRLICEPMDRDAREAVRNKLESLPSQASHLFGSHVPSLLNHFRNLRSDAVKYNAGFTESALADILVRSSPLPLQHTIRLKLEENQEDPDKVAEVLQRLAKTTGACLGASSDLPIQDAAYYVGSPLRPRTDGPIPPRRQGRGRGGGYSGTPRQPPRSTGAALPSPTPSPHFNATTNYSARPSNTTDRPSRGMCWRCGFAGFHPPEKPCPAVDVVCRNCQKTGHFARVCRQSKQKSSGSAGGAPGGGPLGGMPAHLHLVDATDIGPSDSDQWVSLL
eukprot:GHVU01173008.1.p1 GENE.GHVU01173008.1~~GHVU01173008.1.p1  ORF type:complete len:374 (+),score=35.36 GHVU01173008.1:998-2119(+)